MERSTEPTSGEWSEDEEEDLLPVRGPNRDRRRRRRMPVDGASVKLLGRLGDERLRGLRK